MVEATSLWNCYSAPGRVCLYGEHQDYLGLEVIPSAINLRTFFRLKKRQDDKIIIHSENLDITDSFNMKSGLPYSSKPLDYLRAVINVLFKKEIIQKKHGFNVRISSEIPIGSGLSSSAALLISWLIALNHEFSLSLSSQKIAQLAYYAEHDELGINCGIMDQYASALGGIFSLLCNKPPYTIKRFEANFDPLIIADSSIQRQANKPLTILKQQLFQGITIMQEHKLPPLSKVSIDDLDTIQKYLPTQIYKRLKGAIKIRDITKQAHKHLSKSGEKSRKLLGELLTKQHTILRDYLEVSIQALDKLVEVSINAGALGAKLTGAGFGGCIIAYAPGKEKEVTEALEVAGGKVYLCHTELQGGKKEISC
ncbi:MAG: galactokinase family protein [Asgard group archaeon]|nr:galactokinase family protein [Asgard group archaeon]